MRFAILAAGLALLASPALAHDTWLLPAAFSLRAGSTLAADMTSAMAFPRAETAIMPDRIARIHDPHGGGAAAGAVISTR